MGFKRAQWHSGLTYRQVCGACGNEMIYQDDKLDFRPWFADGFVYCSRCKRPLRHSERYAMGGPGAQPYEQAPMTVNGASGGRFCTRCGRKAEPEHLFCSGCGAKLIG